MTSLGIMTLSRSPYSELDKMSLFQDLKLKRRKVDSRCSSDGESLADTNASSPDLIVPLSPKMCDHGGSVSSQQLLSQQSHAKNRHSVSPAALDNDYNSTSTDSTATDVRSDSYMQVSPQSSITVTASKIDEKLLSVAGQTQAIHMSIADKQNAIVTAVAANANMHLNKNIKLINNTNNNSIFISNHSGNERRENIPANENNNDNNNNSNHNNNSSNDTLPNTSVIRLVGEERLPSPTKQTFQPQTTKSTINSLNTPAQRIMSPHATVLVTPLRIKTEANSHQNNCMNPNAASITTAISSMPDYRKAMPSMQTHNSNTIPTVVTIETNNNSSNHLSNCNNGNANGNHNVTNLDTKSTLQRIEADANSIGGIVNKTNPLSPQKIQIVHTTTAQPSVRGVQMSVSKNSFPHQNPAQNNQDANKHQMPPMKNYIFPVNLHAAITNPNPNRIKRERSPIHAINQQTQSLPMSSAQHSQPQNQSITTVTPVTSTGQMLHPSIQLQHPGRDGAILFRVKNDAQLPCLIQTNNQNRIMWNSNTRINGVKPEIIGGPIPLRSPVSNSGHTSVSTTNSNATQPRNTPTVIMGESCGVRTMVWGIETSGNQQSPQTSQPNSINLQNHNQMPMAGPSNNEEAAQLLLSLGQNRTNEIRPLQPQPIIRSQNPLNMERLWAGDYSQLPSGQQIQALNLSSQQQWSNPSQPMKNEQEVPPEDEEQPLVCMICEDKATGLHYGIITCEGCKGFFKRTVQNRRVYTCVADGTCEITKAQRNRCQYCRFKKCIEQGMVLQAVREDRMPGGRNSGAVYNLYKVKYKKHKKSTQKQNQAASALQQQPQQHQQHQQQQQHQQMQQQHQQQQQQQQHQQNMNMICGDTNSMLASQRMNNIKSENVVNNIPSHLLNGTILKTALTNPSEIVHLRHRLDNAVSSSKDRSVSYEHAMSMIQTLIDFDAMEDIATLPHFPEFLEDKSEIGDKLCNIGDSIVHKLVSWTKKLPFYLEIPVEIHTKLLTDKWHEILVLTTAAYQALHGKRSSPKFIQSAQHQSQSPFLEKDDPEYVHEVNTHLLTLQTCLTTLMGHPISMEQLRLDVGHMVEKMTQITVMFRRIKLKMEEYVCLKVYILLNKEIELEGIQERYIQVMRSYLQHTAPNNPGRLGELLAHIPEIQAAASLLLESKMFYVPFVLNSASVR